MLDVPELEKRWSKYHFKKMLPRYIVSGVILSAFGVSAYFYTQHPQMINNLFSDQESKTKVYTAPKTKPEVLSPAVTASDKALLPPSVDEVAYEQNTLVPSLTFLDDLETYQINYENAVKLAAVAAQKKKAIRKAKKVKSPKSKKKPKTKPVKKKTPPATKPSLPNVPEKKAIVIVPTDETVKTSQTQYKEKKIIRVGHDTTSQSELNSLIKRFNHKKKPALSLFIANKYYEQGNYQESYKYAKETLKLNSKIEDAVLIYAKSLMKLGKAEKAKRKLQNYVKQTQSIKAKGLLNKINKGTFK